MAGLLVTGAVEFSAVRSGNNAAVPSAAPAKEARATAPDSSLRDIAVYIDVDANGYPVYRLPSVAIDGAPSPAPRR